VESLRQHSILNLLKALPAFNHCLDLGKKSLQPTGLLRKRRQQWRPNPNEAVHLRRAAEHERRRLVDAEGKFTPGYRPGVPGGLRPCLLEGVWPRGRTSRH